MDSQEAPAKCIAVYNHELLAFLLFAPLFEEPTKRALSDALARHRITHRHDDLLDLSR